MKSSENQIIKIIFNTFLYKIRVTLFLIKKNTNLTNNLPLLFHESQQVLAFQNNSGGEGARTTLNQNYQKITGTVEHSQLH